MSMLQFYMSPQLALVGLAIVPPVAGMAIVYGRFVRNITKDVQVLLINCNTYITIIIINNILNGGLN